MATDLTEKMLTAMVNGYVDELKKLRRGDPAHIRIAARLKVARKELADYQKGKKKVNLALTTVTCPSLIPISNLRGGKGGRGR